MSRLLGLTLVVLAAAAVVFVGSAVAGRPGDASFSYQLVDTNLCTFPLEVTAVGKQKDHLKLQDGSPSRSLITGSIKVTLRNLDTGASTTLSFPGLIELDFANGTATVTGQQLLLAGGIPIASLKGQTEFSLFDGVVSKQTASRSVLDPCALVDPAAAPVVPRTTPEPWNAPFNVLGGIELAGLAPLAFGLSVHTHTHLDVIVNGTPVTVPAGIGIVEPFAASPSDPVESLIGGTSPLHTHFDDGILHIEDDTPPPVAITLGQFFDQWQVRFTSTCLGSYCTGGGSSLQVYVNGVQVTGDPRSIVLSDCDEVAVVYGAPGVPPVIPSTYAWPAGFGCA